MPVQQQQTHSQTPTYSSYQQLPEERCYGDQTLGGSYNRALPSSSLTDHCRLGPSPLDVPGGGRLQEPPYPSHGGLRISPTSSGFRSPHSVYSPASSFPRCQQPMGMNHASLDPTTSSSRGPTQLPNACVPSAPSPVPHDVPSETAEPTIKKKRKRADARQLEALNGVYARTAFPSTEERQQLARDLDMSAGSVQNWLAHTFLYTTSIISKLPTTISLRYKNKRQASRQGGRNPPNPPTSQATGTLFPPVSTVLAFLTVLAALTAAFVVARSLGGAAA